MKSLRLRWLSLAITALSLAACGDNAPPGNGTPKDSGADVDNDTGTTDVPVADTPAVDTPVSDTPVVDTPVVDTPVADTPVADTPVADVPVGDTGGSCPMGQRLCGATCTDTQTDPMNCGACGMACTGGQSCTAGACACPAGQMRCGDACVDVQSSDAHCGMCGNACPMGQTCSAGRCAIPCNAPRMVCGTGAAMTCVDLQSDNANCGTCGTACPMGQTCTAGMCSCPMGQNNCMGRCVNTQTDTANCGACGTACGMGQTCQAGRCACPTGQTDCTGRCVDTSSDTANCGACGTACPSGQLCVSGTCAISCTAPNRICTAGGRMVCVDVQTDNANCGACGTACVTGQSCEMGRCVCPGGQSVCGGACVNTQTDNNNCGACGTACSGGRSCVAGACACPMGQIFCGGRCVNPLTDNANCGACGTACAGGQSCTNGTCACPGGGASCGGRCVNTATDTANCGRCGNMCAAPTNSTATCAAGACGFTCATGFGNCDMNPANGCETNLTNNGLHCGMCGNVCTPPANAFSTCAAGRCGFGCLPNFADCDNNPANGCEVNLLTSGTNCGTCGRICGAGQVCGAGACMTLCPTGSMLCSGVCVNTQTDNANCGACNQRCVAGPNATAACTTGRCGITCNPGFADCNNNPVDGCEVNTQTTVGNCGRCGNVCPSGANSTATCAAGACGVTCATGFGNCDNNASNGCEVNLQTTVGNCGTCGRACPAGANSTATCTAGACGSTCNAGFGDCNGNANDGCETNVNTNVGNCGRCMNACVVPGGGSVACTTGMCVQSCPSGQTACSNTCVNTQLDRANCGRCGNACATGQFCAAGACVTIAGPSFQVNSLTTTACNVIEHATPTGDDRGGIAVSTARVFYTGDSATGRFDLANLGTPTSVGRQYDALTSNLRDGTVYTLATGTTPLPFGGGTADGLVVIDGSTGALTTTRIAFSAPIAMTSGAGIFAGYDRIVLYSGTRFYHVDLRAGSAGAVIDLGAFSFPTRAGCESWAFWGVAEFFAGSLYVDYVQSTTAIARTRVPDGATTVVNTFTNLSDMCSFTISTTNNRWYFHHEFTSQFRSGDETIGYCNATWTTDSPNVSLVTFPSASSQVGTVGFTGTLSAARAAGRRYFTAGDFVTETFTRTSAFSQLTVNFQLDDFTMGCAVGQPLNWNVLVNGTVVGTFGFNGGSGVNPRTITQTYNFASQPAGNVVLRFQATSTVCSGGNSWIWVPGGTATLR